MSMCAVRERRTLWSWIRSDTAAWSGAGAGVLDVGGHEGRYKQRCAVRGQSADSVAYCTRVKGQEFRAVA
jgi:hypothetical protein